jgi:hypothetical protein
MGITLLQIDKSGRMIDQKNYSIVVVKNNEEVYGVNVPQQLKNRILDYYNKGYLGEISRFRFLLRFHVAVLIQVLNMAIINSEKISIEICNDFDGHFHEIKNMLICNVISLKHANFVLAKFSKPSIIDLACKRFRQKKLIKSDFLIKLDINKLIRIIKK